MERSTLTIKQLMLRKLIRQSWLQREHLFANYKRLDVSSIVSHEHPFKVQCYPTQIRVNSNTIFDSAKLIKQYSTKAIHSVPGKNDSNLGLKKINPTPIITATPKRRHEVIVSPNQENTIAQANKVTKTKADSLLEGSSLLTESEETVSFYSPSPNSS